jgi:hypothetical protein
VGETPLLASSAVGRMQLLWDMVYFQLHVAC